MDTTDEEEKVVKKDKIEIGKPSPISSAPIETTKTSPFYSVPVVKTRAPDPNLLLLQF